MIRDRGTKKWTALMLPEHLKLLKQLNVDFEHVKKPQLDEQGLDRIDELLYIAIEYNYPVVFDLWEDGLLSEVEGTIQFIDEANRVVQIEDVMKNIHRINYDLIAGVEIAD